jgi:3-methyl-2-oxobutanoate hydroxymethyltransferase
MPFMTYQASVEQALRNCGRVLQKTGCHAVKIEGGEFRAPAIAALVQNGIPVLAHVGLTPQSVKTLGIRVQGRGDPAAQRLLADAKAVEAAGAFAVVVEAVPAPLGAQLSAALNIPVIGIGAGPGCDGQVLVLHDLLGLTLDDHVPRHVKRYADLRSTILDAVGRYREDVQSEAFPGDEQSFH